MITDAEMISMISERVLNIDFHILILSKDISDYPDSDIEGKVPRQNVLEDLIRVKLALEEESLTISNKML